MVLRGAVVFCKQEYELDIRFGLAFVSNWCSVLFCGNSVGMVFGMVFVRYSFLT